MVSSRIPVFHPLVQGAEQSRPLVNHAHVGIGLSWGVFPTDVLVGQRLGDVRIGIHLGHLIIVIQVADGLAVQNCAIVAMTQQCACATAANIIRDTCSSVAVVNSTHIVVSESRTNRFYDVTVLNNAIFLVDSDKAAKYCCNIAFTHRNIGIAVEEISAVVTDQAAHYGLSVFSDKRVH